MAPWWGIHRDAIRDALLSEMSQRGNVVAVEVTHTYTYTHKHGKDERVPNAITTLFLQE